MLGLEWLKLVELALGAVLPVVMWQMWKFNAAAERIAKAAEAAQQQSWDNWQKLQLVEAEINRLREEHKDIQGAQTRAEEALGKFADAVSADVRTIMRDHGEHEVGQALIQAKLDELVRTVK